MDAATVRGVVSFVGVQSCLQRVTTRASSAAKQDIVSLHCNGDERDDIWQHTQDGPMKFVGDGNGHGAGDGSSSCLVAGPPENPQLHVRACVPDASADDANWGANHANWRRIVEPTKYRQSTQLQSVEYPSLCVTRAGIRKATLAACVALPSQLSDTYQVCVCVCVCVCL